MAITINNVIVNFAKAGLGIKEIPGNKGFKDFDWTLGSKDFETDIKTLGEWTFGAAWCASFSQMIWLLSYIHVRASAQLIKIIDDFMTPSVITTYYSAKKTGLFEIIEEKGPTIEPGALGIMRKFRKGKPLWLGHEFIVEKIEGETVHSIDGNTNEYGAREGETVARKQRLIDFPVNIVNGVALIAFINPIQVEIPKYTGVVPGIINFKK